MNPSSTHSPGLSSRRWLTVVGVLFLVACAATRYSEWRGTTGPPTTCSANVALDTAVFDTTQVSERPTPRRPGPLAYPSRLEGAGTQGHVGVAVVLSAQGLVEPSSIVILQATDSGFVPPVREFLAHVLYWPACRGAHPVRVRILVPFDFKVAHR